jgi:hypothetical protein
MVDFSLLGKTYTFIKGRLKRVLRMSVMEILCTQVCKWKKMRPVENVPGMGGVVKGE